MTFRNNNPAVFGIRVDIGTLKTKNLHLQIKSGKKIGTIHSLEADGKTVKDVKIWMKKLHVLYKILRLEDR